MIIILQHILAEVEGLEEEIKQLNEQAESPYSQAEQTRLQLLSELGEKRNQIQSQLTELRANEGVATEQDTIHVVTATKSGILHYLQPLSIGMSLQQNQIVGEIATDEEGFYVDCYIQAQDRSKVEVGQPVNVAVVGVNNYRFGTISGTVEFIEPVLSELGEKRNQIQSQLTELRANEGVATEQDTVHVVTATKSGILHYLQPLSIGMSLQQNQIVGEIATDEEGFYVDSYIQAQDRSKVEVGQPVNVAVVGVNNYRFGTLSGTVEFIEPGTIQNETAEGVISFYRARVSLDEDFLASKSGEVVKIIRSMPIEARIVYQEESYLEWLLDLLNLRSN